MEIPGLGVVVDDDAFDAYRSKAIAVPALGGLECEFVVQGYDEEDAPEDFHAAIRTFLELGPSVLTEWTASAPGHPNTACNSSSATAPP